MHGTIGKCSRCRRDGGGTIEMWGLGVRVRVGDDVVGMRVDGGRGWIMHTDVAVWLSGWVAVSHDERRSGRRGGKQGERLGREEGRKELLLKAAS